MEYHSDSSCATDNYSYDWSYSSLVIGDVATFDSYGSSGGSGHETTMNLETITYTPLSSSDVTWDNYNSWCGETDWVLNTANQLLARLVEIALIGPQVQPLMVCIYLMETNYFGVIATPHIQTQ